MRNQIRNALLLPADWKVEAPRSAPGETGEYEDAADQEPEAQEGEQDEP